MAPESILDQYFDEKTDVVCAYCRVALLHAIFIKAVPVKRTIYKCELKVEAKK